MKRVVVHFRSTTGDPERTKESFTEVINYVMDDYPMEVCEFDYTLEDYDNLALKFYASEEGVEIVSSWMQDTGEDQDGLEVDRIEVTEADNAAWLAYCEVNDIDPDDAFDSE